MKKIIYATLAISTALTGLIAVNPTTASAKTKHYTNSKTLRHHKYWYSYQIYTGKWHYQRLHFAKHSVYIATKAKRHGKWHQRHITANHYYLRKHNGWYTFGTRNSDDVYRVKAGWASLGGHKHWTLEEFDPSNDNGGYQVSAPYTVWTYTTYLNGQGWHSTINHVPHF